MHRRRFLGLATTGLATAIALPALSACGAAGGAGGDVTLTLIAADYGTVEDGNGSQAYWDKLAEAFEADNPGITIDVKVYSWSEVDAKVDDLVKAGKAPDIAQIGAYAAYAAQGKLYSAGELLTVSTQADFIVSLAQAGEQDRVQYGLPFVSSSRMLFCNEELFADAGITSAPKTWDDIAEAAGKLDAAGVEMPYGLPLGPEESQAETLIWLLGNKGGYTDGAGTYSLDSSENIQTFMWLKQNLVAPGLTGTDPAKTNRQDVFDAFLAGKAGMINGHPTLLKEAQEKGIKIKAVPVPGKDQRTAKTLGVADWVLAFKQNGHAEEIGRFLQFMYNQENSLEFLNKYNLLPVTTSASEAMREDAGEKDNWPFLDLLPSAQYYPVSNVNWGPVSDQLKKTIGQAVHGNPQTILTDLQRFAENAASAG